MYQTGRIPKIIHQTYQKASGLSTPILTNIAQLKSMNEGWEYRFYDDDQVERFIRDHYGPAMLNYFLSINPNYGAARADFFRYLLIYEAGGVYLDIKSTAFMPLDDVIQVDDCYLISQWDNRRDEDHPEYGIHPEVSHLNGGEFQQWYIAAAPKHPFLEAVIRRVIQKIENYCSKVDGVGQMGVLRVTGPLAYTLAIAPILNNHAYRYARTHLEYGFKYSILNGNSHQNLFKNHYSTLAEPIIRKIK